MIPQKIHYCWFGHNPLPECALKCIESWKHFLPDYEIIEWNEDNFNINVIPYTRDAYDAGKYAFVSDYARFFVLFNYGGLYFDTDVELIRPLDDVIESGAFMGAETPGDSSKRIFPKIAPGLCLGAPKNLPFIGRVLDAYKNLNFIGDDGTFNKYTMIPLVTDLLINEGMTTANTIQTVANINLYPPEYFNPLDIATGQLKITSNTRSIHWFMASWLPAEKKWLKKCKQYARRIIRYFKR